MQVATRPADRPKAANEWHLSFNGGKDQGGHYAPLVPAGGVLAAASVLECIWETRRQSLTKRWSSAERMCVLEKTKVSGAGDGEPSNAPAHTTSGGNSSSSSGSSSSSDSLEDVTRPDLSPASDAEVGSDATHRASAASTPSHGPPRKKPKPNQQLRGYDLMLDDDTSDEGGDDFVDYAEVVDGHQQRARRTRNRAANAHTNVFTNVLAESGLDADDEDQGPSNAGAAGMHITINTFGSNNTYTNLVSVVNNHTQKDSTLTFGKGKHMKQVKLGFPPTKGPRDENNTTTTPRVTVDVLPPKKPPAPKKTDAFSVMNANRAKAGGRYHKRTVTRKDVVCSNCACSFKGGGALATHQRKCLGLNRTARANSSNRTARGGAANGDSGSSSGAEQAAEVRTDARSKNSGSANRNSYTIAFKKKVLDAIANFRVLKAKFPSLHDMQCVVEAAVRLNVPQATVRAWDSSTARAKILKAYKENPKQRQVGYNRYNYKYILRRGQASHVRFQRPACRQESSWQSLVGADVQVLSSTIERRFSGGSIQSVGHVAVPILQAQQDLTPQAHQQSPHVV